MSTPEITVVNPPDDERQLGHRLLELLDERTRQLQQLARTLVDEYWLTHTQESIKRSGKDRGYTVPRCRLLKGTLHIEWFRQRTAKTLNPQTQQRYVFSDYLPKGRECRYPDAVFQRVARDWELPLIQDYEARFADLRRRARALSQLRVQVRRRLLRPVTPAPERGHD